MQSGGLQTVGSGVGLTARRFLRVQGRFWGRAWRRLGGLFGMLLVLGLLGTGGYMPTAIFGPWEQAGSPMGGRVQAVTAALGLMILLFKLGERLTRRTAPVVAWRRFLVEMEGGGALLLITYALLQTIGGTTCALHPLVYAVCAFLVSFHRRQVAVSLAGLALFCEVLLLHSEGVVEVERYAVHALLMCAFAALHFVLFRGELWRQRGDHRRRVADAIASMQQQARDFRLLLADDSLRREGPAQEGMPLSGSPLHPTGPGTRDRAEEEELLARGAVVELQQNLHATVELLKNALHLHTCALLVLPSGSEQLKVIASASNSPRFSAASLSIDAGVVGTVVKSRRLVNLQQPKAGQLPYYLAGAAATEMAAFLGVPLLEEGKLVAVLCADRAGEGGAFTPADESLLLDAALLISRSLQCERLFIAVERSKYEHERLYRASSRLSRALTPEEVHHTAFAALAEVCSFDFAALTAYEPNSSSHRVIATDGDPLLTASTLHTRFPDNSGFVAMAVKNRTTLPAGGELRDHYTPIFDSDVRLRGYPSLLVVPLSYGDAATGALVVAGKRPKLFSPSKIDMLGVLANQIAVSLENARMYRAMEAMATTDGLTGLKTRRVFQERLSEMLRRAERHSGKVTLIISDIDFFKKINDTYGHLTGDQVLRRVAQVVSAQARNIDVAARYGGEEFVVLLDGTDLHGGRLFAERVRQEVQKLVLHSDKGAFACTLSLGVATFPDDASEGQLLIDCADQALFHAKRQGRNQSIAWRDVGPVSNSNAA
jgi:two-component system cell cycle response regulator